jgi:hypothetical protein
VEVVTVIVGGFRYRILPRPLRILVWLIVFNVGETAIEWTLASFSIHNLWISHINTLVEFFFMVLLFSSWVKQKRIRLVLLVCFMTFIVLWITSKFSFEPFTHIDGWTATLSKILQVVFSIVLLLDVVKEVEIIWTNDPRFWVAAGIIIYSAGSLFMFALFNKMLMVSPDRLRFVWSLNWILMIVSNLLYVRGFLCKK